MFPNEERTCTEDRIRTREQSILAGINQWKPITSPFRRDEEYEPMRKKRRSLNDPRKISSQRFQAARPRVTFGFKRFDDYQQLCIREALKGKCMFITGGAGTGKTFVLQEIISRLKKCGKNVAVTASTGCAAVALKGTTVHSFLGLGYNAGKSPQEAMKQTSHKIRDKVIALDVLVIDEISMLNDVVFDRIEAICRRARVSRRGQYQRFGGLQIIVSGDFCQLPPISLGKENEEYHFCFESKAWKNTIRSCFLLKASHRQSNYMFATLLEELRFGIVSPFTMTMLNILSFPLHGVLTEQTNNIGFTKLFPCRFQVDRENCSRLRELNGIGIRFVSSDRVAGDVEENDKKQVHHILNSVQAPRSLKVKTGCKVLCIKNLNQDLGIVNGLAGEVVGFTLNSSLLPVRKPISSCGLVGKPSTSNSKGNVHQRYSIFQLREDDFRNDPQFCPTEGFLSVKADSSPFLPVVKFDNGICTAVGLSTWDITSGRDESIGYRTQVSLTLGWALSIHKSQGMSLNKVQVELKAVFDYGQAYVALSRARSLFGLRVTGFHKRCVATHPKAISFYKSLYRD